MSFGMWICRSSRPCFRRPLPKATDKSRMSQQDPCEMLPVRSAAILVTFSTPLSRLAWALTSRLPRVLLTGKRRRQRSQDSAPAHCLIASTSWAPRRQTSPSSGQSCEQWCRASSSCSSLYRQSASALPLYRSSCSPKSGLAQLYKHCLVWLLAAALRCVAIALSIALTSSVHAFRS